jgi:hypothetical protein
MNYLAIQIWKPQKFEHFKMFRLEKFEFDLPLAGRVPAIGV